VFALTSVRDVPRPAGQARTAGQDDRGLLLDWLTAFALEALSRPDDEIERTKRTLDRRISGADGGIWLWDVGGTSVSLAGFPGPALAGARVGPVYTPPEHRRRGYATALVADLSRFLLGQGHRACFLYTDLSNPTSNAIYERIGYERVAEAAEISFRPS
jgi:hypothetical protein